MKNKNPIPATLAVIHSILDQITFHPEKRRVDVVDLGPSSVIEIQVHGADIGRVVGTKGAHVKALTALVEHIGTVHGHALTVDLQDPIDGAVDARKKFVPAEKWNSAGAVKLASELTDLVCEFPVTIEIFNSARVLSSLVVVVSDEEKHNTVSLMSWAFRNLFVAVGRAEGRTLLAAVMRRTTFENSKEGLIHGLVQ